MSLALTVFENKRRQAFLRRFRNLVAVYEEDTREDLLGVAPIEGPRAQAARVDINRSLERAQAYVRDAGVRTAIRWIAPAIMGGHIQPFDLLTDLFRLPKAGISLQEVLDVLDRALGVYQAGEAKARWRTYNPLFWLARLLAAGARLPFRALNAAGVSTDALERGWKGAVIRGSLCAIQAAILLGVLALIFRD